MKNNDNNKINGYGISVNSVEYAKKLKRLKSQKLSWSQKLFKSGKLKSKNWLSQKKSYQK